MSDLLHIYDNSVIIDLGIYICNKMRYTQYILDDLSFIYSFI